MDKTLILNSIKEYYKFDKDSDFARFLEITPQVLYNWKIRNSYDAHLLYTKCTDINPEWILTGQGKMLKKELYNTYTLDSEVPKVQEPATSLKLSDTNIPLYDLDKNGSLKSIFNKEKDIIVSAYISVPGLSNCDGASYVRGDSMSPVLKSGDIILFKQISLDSIFYGEMYFLEIQINKNHNFLIIRHIQKSDLGNSFIKLTSSNPNYEPKDIRLDTINALAVIRGSIKAY